VTSFVTGHGEGHENTAGFGALSPKVSCSTVWS
jgi:hypothetical protein